MQTDDTICVTREHRWISTAEQIARLSTDGCRIIVSLDGAGKRRQVSLEQLAQLVRPGTVVKLVHSFLLVDQGRKRAATIKANFAAALRLLVDKRKGIVRDVDAGITTATPGQRKALVALAEQQIGRSRQGLAAVEENKRRRGRSELPLDKMQKALGKVIWLDVDTYPNWPEAERALQAQVHPEFTKWRANRMWGKRPPKRKQ